jgi:hypothetical protein
MIRSVVPSKISTQDRTHANKPRNELLCIGRIPTLLSTLKEYMCAFVCRCSACGLVLELEVCRVRFARVSCPRLRFDT